MDHLLEQMIKKKRIIARIMILVMGLAICIPVQTLYAEEITTVENSENVTPAAVEEERQPEASQVPVSTERPNTLVVKSRKCTYPKKIYEGQQFTIKGTIRANHKINKVVASIMDENGEKACSVRKRGKSKEFDLKKVDDNIKFSQLEAGTYKYEVEVTDNYGNNRVALEKEFKVKESSWMWPVENSVLGDGYRCKCSSHGGKHFGVDIKGVSRGTKIRAVKDGEVVYAQYHGASTLASFGKLVIIYHGNGIYSYYAHCNSLKCEAGDKVSQGDVIATVGATGAAYGTHLHLELRKGPAFNGKYNHYKLLDKYRYKQFDPMKKNYLRYH